MAHVKAYKIEYPDDYLKSICNPKGVLLETAGLLERISRQGVGIGEVLQDYARQSSGQLQSAIAAAKHILDGKAAPDEIENLRKLPQVVKTVGTVLEMTPAAMLRNKADCIGEKDKIMRSDIVQACKHFAQSPEVLHILSEYAESSAEAVAE